ncbi:MAG TPA: MmgE/PrpD family protein [Burkholderiales bacterium]|nr:MmgE/PrpD family protein [Burkholderiales bacterium]
MSAVMKPEAQQQAATEHPLIARTLAEFALNLTIDRVPAPVVERAKLHILDCIGIALASTQFEFAHRTLSAVRGLAGDGPYAVIGMPARLPLRDAVLVNGVLIHGLDFDDTHSGGVIHASASAVATLLGAGLAHNASGAEALAAYLVAVEAGARLGMAANGAFHQIGFHPTGLIGAFGCTLAAGRLQGLTAEQLHGAQGIVLSMAAGSLEFLEDGAWTKRMHPGWAGVCGITAAALAAQGFVGPKRAYEGRFGLYHSHYGGKSSADLSLCTAGLGTNWEMANVALKPYPACHFNHAFADAALELKRRHGIDPAQVKAVTARIGAGEVKTVCEPEANKKSPANAYDAQFSVHYTIAAALAKGRFTLAELTEEAIRDPGVLALAARVRYETDPDSAFPRYYSGEVVVEMQDGRVFRQREAQNRGSDARPLTAGEIVDKFRANAGRAFAGARIERIIEATLALDTAPDLAGLAAAVSA